jgi:hypothetical protein
MPRNLFNSQKKPIGLYTNDILLANQFAYVLCQKRADNTLWDIDDNNQLPGFVKIGTTSKSMDDIVAQYGKRHWPFGFQLLFYHHMLTENFLHARFKELRISKTEWFALEGDLLKFLRNPSIFLDVIKTKGILAADLSTYQIQNLFGVPD